LHRYADAAWQQEAAARVDHAYMMRDGVLPDQIHNYAHNNEWLIRNLASIGRLHDAVDLAKNMLELPRHPKYNLPDRVGSSANLGRVRLVDTLVEYERWSNLISLFDSSYLPPLNTPEDQLQRARLLGRAHAELGHADQARGQLAALEEMLIKERAARYQSADAAEAKARTAGKNDEETARLMADALKAHAPRVQSLEHAIAEVKGFLALVASDRTAARAVFDKLKDGDYLRSDHLAQVYLRLGDAAAAESLARAAVSRAPGEVYPLSTLVAVLQAGGKKAEASAEFAKLRTLAGNADLDQPVFERLGPLVKELHLPADWRIAQAPNDAGQRPSLATLGPFRWQPTPAPAWSLPQPDGSKISLEQYRGKPVLVLFYLGSGCLHCVEQLKSFSPLVNQFAGEGISIVAVSSESPDSLRHSLTTLKAGETINFPLVSDTDRSVFRAYRAYDDFENMPLHGVYLIDGAGLVRWHDIGYEPFMDAGFVLEEARRLLHPSVGPPRS
jgi:peroxiredoxin